MLAAGSVNLTTVRLLGPHLTAENHRGVLESARGKRKAEVEEIVARLSPRPEVPATVRKLPEKMLEPKPATEPAAAALRAPQLAGQLAPAPGGSPPVFPPPDSLCKGNDALQPPRPTRRGEITPLSPDRYKLQLTIGGSTLEKLRLAKDMLRHAIPSGDDEAVLDRALTVLLADLARRKFAATEKPGRSRGAAPASRHIPAEVKRAVWLRDLGRCAFVAADGRRCSERGFLEFHHVRPYAAGGEATVSNIRLTCKRHNGYEARVYFGHKRIADDVRNEWAPGTIVREQAAAYGRGASAAAFVPASELRPEDVLPPGCRRQSFRNELETQGRPPGRFEGLTQPAKRLGAPQDP